jgi:hypothetical protein
MGLKIYKIAEKVFRHNDTVKGDFILSKFYAKEEFDKFLVVEIYGSEHLKYSINDIEVYDIGGSVETFANFDDLFTRLAELRYTAFYSDGESEVNWGFILGDINSQTDLITRLNAKLNTDISTYTNVSLPLEDTDELLVNRSGTWYKVDKSEIGGGGGSASKTFNLSIPKVTITRSVTPLYYAQGLSGSVLLNNSTGLSDGSVLNSIGGITTTLFCIPYDCKLQVVIMHTNAIDFDLSIWKSDDFANPTTNAVRIFQANTTTGVIENYAVASIDLQQGNLIQPFVKINTGTSGTNLGEIFLTFEAI